MAKPDLAVSSDDERRRLTIREKSRQSGARFVGVASLNGLTKRPPEGLPIRVYAWTRATIGRGLSFIGAEVVARFTIGIPREIPPIGE